MNLNFIDNNSRQLILFDMDGVLAEFIAGEELSILNECAGIYFNKRPLKNIIAIAEDLSMKDILNYIDILIDGPYIDELKDLNLSYRGSSN